MQKQFYQKFNKLNLSIYNKLNYTPNPFIQMYNPPLRFKNSKHCDTCYCSNVQTEYQLNTPPNGIPFSSGPSLLYSRNLAPNDPSTQQVGQNVIRDRIVWFKSTSARPSRITIKVSTPDKPNLRSSLYYESLQKRRLSEQPAMLRKVSYSRLTQPEAILMTPINKITHRVSVDKFDQSSIMTIPSTQKRYLDLSKVSFGQSEIY